MRHPTIRQFLIWLPPAAFAGLMLVCQTFPAVGDLVAAVFAKWWSAAMADWQQGLIAIGAIVFPIAVWVAMFAWASAPPKRKRYTISQRALEGMRRTMGRDPERKDDP